MRTHKSIVQKEVNNKLTGLGRDEHDLYLAAEVTRNRKGYTTLRFDGDRGIPNLNVIHKLDEIFEAGPENIMIETEGYGGCCRDPVETEILVTFLSDKELE